MITYESICKKLGFRLEDYKPETVSNEDDSIENPFRKLTHEELNFLKKYAMNMSK